MVCVTASAMKPSASRLIAMIGNPHAAGRRDPHAIDETEGDDRRPDQPMPRAQLERFVEQRAREQPEHHDIAGRQRDQRRMPDRDRRRRCRSNRSRHAPPTPTQTPPPAVRPARCRSRETATPPAPAAAPRWRRARRYRGWKAASSQPGPRDKRASDESSRRSAINSILAGPDRARASPRYRQACPNRSALRSFLRAPSRRATACDAIFA